MKLDKLIKKLNIDTNFTKGLKRPKRYTRVKDATYPKQDYNFMADLLQLPESLDNYKYLLVVVDLWSDEFDIEPLKTTKSKEALSAFKKIIKRPYLNMPFASIATDGGPEFQGLFKKYFFESNVLKKTTKKGRKTQNANVESLNRILARLLNGYMNTQEMKTKKPFFDWNNKKVLDIIRKDLNDLRRRKDGEIKLGVYNNKVEPKFKVGDLVYYYLDTPINTLGEEQRGTFREGDIRWSLKPKKIKQVLRFAGEIPFRYMLNYITNASYTEKQLKK
jgi:hypothetical protein